MPQTNKGKNGRPRGEPEAFTDYNIIYQIMSTSKKGRTEGKQREQSKELRPERDAHRANKDPKKSKVVIVRDR